MLSGTQHSASVLGVGWGLGALVWGTSASAAQVLVKGRVKLLEWWT